MYHKLDHEHGPFDIIGDVHGCADELAALLERLGYRLQSTNITDTNGLSLTSVYRHPQGRKAIFVGDLVDRGRRILDTLRVAATMTQANTAFCVTGNHDDKLLRLLKGHNVQITHGLEHTQAELDALPEVKRENVIAELQRFLESLPNHYILDNGQLIIAHAGLKESLHGTSSDKTRAFALYGESTGQKDEYGLPIRGNWPAKYHGQAWVVYGHTPVPEPVWLNNTVNIDTGCVFGGKLTALRYPEMETVSVIARHVYCESARPFPTAASV